VWHLSVGPALRAFAAAAGEIPEDEWWLGWPGTPELEEAEPRTA
jgi:hypothetical protein